jgi:hypothetical protein
MAVVAAKLTPVCHHEHAPLKRIEALKPRRSVDAPVAPEPL